MDITFITMHDLTPEATVLYASDSIGDVLGYDPRDVVGKSCFEYFEETEISQARKSHGRGVKLDKAAMLAYCNLKRKNGSFVRCECVFTVVYSVIVACTSLYRYTDKSIDRAYTAPAIRRAFSQSDKEPRYRMLSHLSPKFTIPHTPHTNHEPRAAIILNRFTRTLAILYATHTLSDILGIPSEDAIGRSFYECISEDCLDDAIEALERAKENDSIAYLRFRWRDPRTDGSQPSSNASDSNPDSDSDEEDAPAAGTNPSRAVRDRRPTPTASAAPGEDTIEVEAVVSCTSDGLVVILRRAHGPLQAHGVFASPWSQTPLEPSSAPRNQELMETIRQVAVFAWSLRSINPDIMMHAVPGRPDPDAAEKMGDFVRPGTSHWKRQREWEGEDDDDDEDEDRKGKKKAKVTDRVIRDPRNPGGGRRNGDGALGNEKRVA